jgi:anti-anti-sigma factor
MAGVNEGSQADIDLAEDGPGLVTARISGELDIVSAGHLGGQVDDLLARTLTRLDLDLSGLAFMDSSGLALLLRLTNRLGPLRVFGANPLIRRVIEATGLTAVLLLQGTATSSVPGGRQFVAESLSALEPEVGETAALLVSELATNAVVHASSDFAVTVVYPTPAGRVRVEVVDGVPGQPTPLRPPGRQDHLVRAGARRRRCPGRRQRRPRPGLPTPASRLVVLRPAAAADQPGAGLTSGRRR